MTVKPTVTFVTSFLDLEEDRSKDKSVEKCFTFFKKLVDSGIHICVFISKRYYEMAKEICEGRKNVCLMTTIELSDLWTYKTTKEYADISLPDVRTEHHDTYNFLVLMNSKIEFVSKAIQVNPFNTTHFSWIDFSICHVIKSETTLEKLYTYSISLLKNKMLLFPACWPKERVDQHLHILYTNVLWRFCGGFFIGDKDSLTEFNIIYQKYYKIFLEEKKRLVWEVNFWAWLEKNNYFTPDYYIANHDDSIVNIPSEYLKTVACLTTIPSRFEKCKETIDSLLDQVDHIYLSVCKYYKRFGNFDIPDYKNNKVTIVESIDYGPATKYIGALKNIPDGYWVLFCDDDQIYKKNMIKNMKKSIHKIGAYQNRYSIVKNGSGGIIHGYVGNMFHKNILNNLFNFDLPECAYFVDDQWMSIYCFFNNINIFPTGLDNYSEIFSVLTNGHEQIGADSLAYLGNRDSMVKKLAEHFHVIFKENGIIEKEICKTE
jgi:hypothetical protein